MNRFNKHGNVIQIPYSSLMDNMNPKVMVKANVIINGYAENIGQYWLQTFLQVKEGT